MGATRGVYRNALMDLRRRALRHGRSVWRRSRARVGVSCVGVPRAVGGGTQSLAISTSTCYWETSLSFHLGNLFIYFYFIV